jgi:hypothetical protein
MNLILLFFAGLVGSIVGVIIGYQLAGELLAPRLNELKAFGDEWKQAAKERQAVIDRMRNDGYAIQRAAVVKELPDLETEGLARAEADVIRGRADRAFVERAKRDIMEKNPNINSRDAEREAVRLRKETLMEDPPT